MRIVLTGANRGIGKALATAYRAAGDEVIGTARNDSETVMLDVTRPDDFDALKAAVADRPVDLVICNAGIYPDKGESLDTGYSSDIWAQAMAVNVTGVFLTIQALLPALGKAPQGKIVIISSQMASDTLAPGGSYVYRASKAAVLNLGRNLAADLRGRGIAVGIYHPGWVRTDMGGGQADIGTREAAEGLMRRFAALSPETTGCFETWDGRAHPF